MNGFEEKFNENKAKISKVRRNLVENREEEERLKIKYDELMKEKQKIVEEELEKKGWEFKKGGK